MPPPPRPSARTGVDVIPVPVDFSATADLVAVAGEITAWT